MGQKRGMPSDVVIRVGFAQGSLRWSAHALSEAEADGLLPSNIETAVKETGTVIEDYPEAVRGATCLVLTYTADGPVHVVVAYGAEPWVVVTVYVPNPDKWLEGFTKRR